MDEDNEVKELGLKESDNKIEMCFTETGDNTFTITEKLNGEIIETLEVELEKDTSALKIMIGLFEALSAGTHINLSSNRLVPIAGIKQNGKQAPKVKQEAAATMAPESKTLN
jgi:hypothetical protein